MTDRLLRDVARPAVLALMAAIFGMALQRAGTLFVPTWNGSYLPWLLAAVVLETYLSHRTIQAVPLRGVAYIRFRLAELLVLSGMTRLAPYLAGARGWDELGTWLTAPQLVFASIEAWSAFAPVLLIWQSLKPTFRDFDVIDGPTPAAPALPAYSLTAQRQEHLAYTGDLRDYSLAYHTLSSRFLQGGIVLLLVTAFASVELRGLLSPQPPAVYGGLFGGVGFYFLSGLVILGIIRLVGLRRRWQAEYTHIDSSVAHNWLFYLAVLLAGAGAVAALLPTAYAIPVLVVAGQAIQFLISATVFVVLALVFLITFPIVWMFWFIASLFGYTGPAPSPIPPVAPPVPPTLPPQMDTFGLVQAIFLWALIGVGLWYLLKIYVGDRVLSPRRLPRALRGGWHWFVQWWATWRTRWQRRPRLQTLADLPTTPPATIRRPRPARLSGPRGAIVDLYLRFLRRTQQEGHPRRAAETPEEYKQRLGTTLPDLEPDSTLLTSAFTEARYAPHDPTPDTVQTAQGAWERVRKLLRAKEN